VSGGIHLLLKLDAFCDCVVHAFLHEAAVIVVRVGHVVRGRGGLFLLLLLRGAGQRECHCHAEDGYG